MIELNENILTPIFENFEQMSSSEVCELEKQVGHSFPPEFVYFLSNFGSCMFVGNAGVRIDEEKVLPINAMYGSKTSDRSIIKDWIEHPDYSEAGYIPIAEDFFGDRFVLDTQDNGINHIHYSSQGPSVTRVAENFSKFLQKIEITPYDDE